jgi:hypothetical protein
MQSIAYSPHDAEVFERSVENRKSFFGKFFGRLLIGQLCDITTIVRLDLINRPPLLFRLSSNLVIARLSPERRFQRAEFLHFARCRHVELHRRDGDISTNECPNVCACGVIFDLFPGWPKIE